MLVTSTSVFKQAFAHLYSSRLALVDNEQQQQENWHAGQIEQTGYG